MTEPDAELKETFAKLGIELVETAVLPQKQWETRPYSAADNAELLHWLKNLRGDSPPKLVAEIRKRRLLAEDELRLWLGTDTGAA